MHLTTCVGVWMIGVGVWMNCVGGQMNGFDVWTRIGWTLRGSDAIPQAPASPQAWYMAYPSAEVRSTNF